MKDDKELIKFNCSNRLKEVYHHQEWLCCFGKGDLYIRNDLNIEYASNSGLGMYYESPAENDFIALAGNRYFKVLEMEAF